MEGSLLSSITFCSGDICKNNLQFNISNLWVPTSGGPYFSFVGIFVQSLQETLVCRKPAC